MKYASLDLGTIEAVVNKLGGMEGVKSFLNGSTEVVAFKILSLVNGNIVSDAVHAFDLQKFYGSIEGIRFPVNTVKNFGAASLKSYELRRDSYDWDIAKDMPEKFQFDLSEALARIAQMIERQSDGKGGAPLSNGNENLFYVSDLVLRVRWDVSRHEWHVYPQMRDLKCWSAGDRVFSNG
jgi:hypothetical protein